MIVSDDGRERRPRATLSRRSFLTIGAGGVGFAAAPKSVRWLWDAFEPELVGATTPSFTYVLTRPADQLRLLFEFVNLVRSGNRIVPQVAGDPQFVRIVLGSQHTVEEAIVGNAVPPAGALHHRSAGTTRLVFLAHGPFPFTTAFLLDLAARVPKLDPRANPRGGLGLTAAPSVDVTAIEIPEGLILTPGTNGRFVSPTAPITFGDVTETWRANLGVAAGGGVVHEPPDGAPTVRAIYEAGGNDTFTRPLVEVVRQRIVAATSDYADTTKYPNHEPIAVNRLCVSPLCGGWIDLAGTWSGGSGALVAWVHKAATGRDIDVKVTNRGFLAPFGIPCGIVAVTQREFREDAHGDVEAVVVQNSFLALDTGAVFPQQFQPDAGRRMPFKSVTIAAEPANPIDIDDITWDNGAKSIGIDKAVIITDQASNTPLLIEMIGIDHAGTPIPFSLPVVFVSETEAYNVPAANGSGSIVDDLVAFYADDESHSFREVFLSDQPVSFAFDSASAGQQTVKTTRRLRFSLELPDAGVTTTDLTGAKQPAFFPYLVEADVRDSTADALQGTSSVPHTARYTSLFRDHGFGPLNTGGTFLWLSSPLDITFAGEGAGIATANYTIDTFSLALGAGPLPPLPGTSWDPASLLNAGSSFLGNLVLSALVKAVTVGSDIGATEGLPHVRVDFEGTPVPTQAVLNFDWCPPVRSSGIFIAAEDLGDHNLPALLTGDTTVCFEVEQVVPLAGGPATATVESAITNFALAVPGDDPVLAVFFNELRFVQPSDGPRDLRTDIEAVRFQADLAWLEPLQEFLAGTTGSFSIQADSSGLEAQLNLALPDLSFGVVNVGTPTIGVDVTLPFTDDAPTIGLSVGTREDPIRVTVMGIGGTVWFALVMEAGADPFKRFEMQLAVVLEAEADFVIGSAGVRLSIGAGIDVHDDGTVALTAFVSITGVVELLGFKVLSAEATASLEYRTDPTTHERTLKGTLYIMIGSGILEYQDSISVTLLLEDGSGARGALAPASTGPTYFFGDRYSSADWGSYCGAFA